MGIKKDRANCHPIKSIHDFLSPSRSEEQWAARQAGSVGDNQSEVAAAAVGTVEGGEYGRGRAQPAEVVIIGGDQGRNEQRDDNDCAG